MELIDRHAERDTLNRLVAAVRDGEGRALVVCGEAGVGKTALLDYLADNASGCRVVRTAGCQSEMELAFAALHQLCTPLLEGLTRLPAPQRDALRIAFGMGSGSTPDRFLVGLAVLNLFSDAAEPQPLICVLTTSSGLTEHLPKCWASLLDDWWRNGRDGLRGPCPQRRYRRAVGSHR